MTLGAFLTTDDYKKATTRAQKFMRKALALIVAEGEEAEALKEELKKIATVTK